jgi:hypothetical protein
MAHEKSITVGEAGNVYNIPSVVNGTDIGADAAMKLFFEGRLAPLEGPFQTIEQGVNAAKARSNAFRPENSPISPNELFSEQ